MKEILFLVLITASTMVSAKPIHVGGGIPDLRNSKPIGPVNDPRGRLVYYNCEISKLVGPGHNAKVYEETLFAGPDRNSVAKKCKLKEYPDRLITIGSLPKKEYIKKFGKSAAAKAETLGELNASGRGPISGPPRHAGPNSVDTVLSCVCGENKVPVASSTQPSLVERVYLSQSPDSNCSIIEELL